MKFTEGYWEKNERANASYAMQAFTAEAIPGGMRIVSPFRQITDRGGALDVELSLQNLFLYVKIS